MATAPHADLTVLQPSVALADPHVCSDARDRLNVLAAIYEPLVRRGPGGSFRPVLAQAWTLDDDACMWVFSLRPGVRFHNGDRLASADVVATLARVCDPAMGGELGTQGVYRSYLAGADIQPIDAQTIQIRTAEPMADLLDVLVDLPIAPRRALDGLPGEPVGSGPYRLERDEGESLILHAFPDYWGAAPAWTRLAWQAAPDEHKRIERLLAGTADLATELSATGLHLLAEQNPASIVTRPSSACVILMCNLLSGPCTDRRVRQALNYAADVPGMVAELRPGCAAPLNGPLTPLHLGYDPATPPYAYDPDRARALLSEAGYDKISLTLDLPHILPDEAPAIGERLRRDYARVGIDLHLRLFTNRPDYATMVREKRIDDLCCFDSTPLSTFRVLHEKFHGTVRGPWWQGYADPDVDALLDWAQATADPARRQEFYRESYRRIRDAAPWVFLYSPLLVWGVGPRLAGWQPGEDGRVLLV